MLEAETGAVNRYPDMSCAALYDAIATRFDVPVSELAAATGSVAVLYHLVQALCDPGDEVVYAWRSFEAYPIAVAAGDVRSVRVPLGPGARHDLDAMASAVTDRTRMLLVCTPNNPTGPAVRADELERLLDRVPERVLVVLDAAYTEFVTDPDAADALAAYRQRSNVAVLRTFSKAYGLAGLRVGFAVAHEPIATAVRKVALPFGVSGMAQAAAVASLQPTAEAELMARVADLVSERERVVAGLREAGWDVPDTQANFCWLGARRRHDGVRGGLRGGRRGRATVRRGRCAHHRGRAGCGRHRARGRPRLAPSLSPPGDSRPSTTPAATAAWGARSQGWGVAGPPENVFWRRHAEACGCPSACCRHNQGRRRRRWRRGAGAAGG